MTMVRCYTALFALLMVSACVTETSGPAPVVVDPTVAIQQRVALARQYIGAGDWDNAKRNLELAAEIDAENPEVYEAFALVYQSTGEFELAESNFRSALEAKTVASRVRNNFAAFLYSRGRFGEAARQFEIVTADSLYSERPRAFVNLGLAQLQLGQRSLAKDAFIRSLAMDGNNEIALLELTQLTLNEDDVVAASGYYSRYRQRVTRAPARALILGVEIARLQGDADSEASHLLALRNLYSDAPIYRAWQAAQREQGQQRQ